MYFKRKTYNKLIEWKEKYADKYAVLLEGARRVGKSTIAEYFTQNEYKSYILIDFSKTTDNIRDCFNDIGNLNMFFLRLQAETGVTLYEHESLIIFDDERVIIGTSQKKPSKIKGLPLIQSLFLYQFSGKDKAALLKSKPKSEIVTQKSTTVLEVIL